MALPFEIPRPIRFEAEQEERYMAAQYAQFLPLLQAMIAFYFILQPVYIIWDYTYAEDAFGKILALRALQTALFGGLLLLTVKKGMEHFVIPLASVTIGIIVITLSMILGMVDNGFLLALSGLLVPFVLIPLMPSFMWAVVNAFGAAALVNIFMTYDEVSASVRVNANFYLWTFVFLSILLSILYVYRSRRLFQLEMKMEHIATTDDLSGLSNRRHFMSQSEEVLRAHRYKRPLSVLMMDVDHFKVINDTFGHHAGDVAIREIGKICKHELRRADFVARIGLDGGGEPEPGEAQLPEPVIGRLGGEEFAMLLPETDSEGAALAGERLRAVMQANVIRVDDDKRISFTVSIGVATLKTGDESDTIEELLRRADEALYRAKKEGRNRVIVAEGDEDSGGDDVQEAKAKPKRKPTVRRKKK